MLIFYTIVVVSEDHRAGVPMYCQSSLVHAPDKGTVVSFQHPEDESLRFTYQVEKVTYMEGQGLLMVELEKMGGRPREELLRSIKLLEAIGFRAGEPPSTKS